MQFMPSQHLQGLGATPNSLFPDVAATSNGLCLLQPATGTWHLHSHVAALGWPVGNDAVHVRAMLNQQAHHIRVAPFSGPAAQTKFEGMGGGWA